MRNPGQRLMGWSWRFGGEFERFDGSTLDGSKRRKKISFSERHRRR